MASSGNHRVSFFALGLQELNVHVGPIDPDEFATTIGETSGGQEQKELLEIEALDGTFHREEGICVRYGLKQAIATPRRWP